MLGRHHHVVVACRPCRGRPMPAPCAIQVPEQARIDRLERGDQAARRPLDLDHVVLAPHVDVGLAVRDDQHLVALQVLAQDAAQRVRAPGGLALVARARARPRGRAPAPAGRARSAAARARSLASAERRAQQRLAGQQRLHARDPAAPADLGDDHGDERDHRGDARRRATARTSWCRRCAAATKLMSCTIDQLAERLPSSPTMRFAETCSGPSAAAAPSCLRPRRPPRRCSARPAETRASRTRCWPARSQ